MKSHDVVVLCRLLIFQNKSESWSYRSLSEMVLLSLGETHASVKRLEEAGIYNKMTRSIIPENASEVLIHGVKYMFPAKIGTISRGVLTAFSALVMKNLISRSNDEYIWAYAKGKNKGISIKPLSKDVPKAIENTPELYDMLVLIDCLRIGKVRERKLAENLLNNLIMNKYE